MNVITILGKSWAITRKHWAQLFVMALPTLAFVLYANILSASGNFSLVGVAFFLIAMYLVASLSMGYAKSIETNNYRFANAFVAFSSKYNWPLLLFVSIAALLGISFGFSFFVIPGVILALGWSVLFYQYQTNIENNKKDTFVGIFTQSWDLMKGHKLELFLIIVIFFLINVLEVTIYFFLVRAAGQLNIEAGQIVLFLLAIIFVILFIVLSIWYSVTTYIFYREVLKARIRK